MKKTDFGAGRIVGLGGHIEQGETPAEAAVREVAEEAGIEVLVENLRAAGLVTFRFPARPKWDQVVSVFVSDRFTGQTSESDEVIPHWFPTGDLPLMKMRDDARLWLPRVLAGEQATLEITYADDCETVSGSHFGASTSQN